MFQQEFQGFTEEEQSNIHNDVLHAGVEWQNVMLNPYNYKTSDLAWNYELDTPMFAMRLVQRMPEDKAGFVCSPHWSVFEKVFHRARERMNLPFTNILRSSINCTWHQPVDHAEIHKDHYHKPHYNMILQLTPTSRGGTFLFDEEKNLLGESDVALWSATAFGGLWHAQGFCAPGETRIVCVITWE